MIYLQANRQSRVANLIYMIAEYDYNCFVDARVRDLQNSLKVGFSPDHTTVFLDILDLASATELGMNTGGGKHRPLPSPTIQSIDDSTGPDVGDGIRMTVLSGGNRKAQRQGLGQDTHRVSTPSTSSRSPSSLLRRRGPVGLQDELLVPFSGEGSYFFPLFLDPNDILVKCVPQMPAQSTFIDKTWLAFVHELNLSLRCVNFDFLDRSLPQVLQCLNKYMRGSHRDTLGSLEIRLVKISYACDDGTREGSGRGFLGSMNNSNSGGLPGAGLEMNIFSPSTKDPQAGNLDRLANRRTSLDGNQSISKSRAWRSGIVETDAENENSDYINADYYDHNPNNYTRSERYASQQRYDWGSEDDEVDVDDDDEGLDDDSCESRDEHDLHVRAAGSDEERSGENFSDNERGPAQSRRLSRRLSRTGCSGTSRARQYISNGMHVHVSDWNLSPATRFVSGDRLGLHIVCHGGARLSSLNLVDGNEGECTEAGSTPVLASHRVSTATPTSSVARRGSFQRGLRGNSRHNIEARSVDDSFGMDRFGTYATRSKKPSIRDIEIGGAVERSDAAELANGGYAAYDSGGSDEGSRNDTRNFSDDGSGLDSEDSEGSYTKRAVRVGHKSDRLPSHRNRRKAKSKFSPFGTGLADLMAVQGVSNLSAATQRRPVTAVTSISSTNADDTGFEARHRLFGSNGASATNTDSFVLGARVPYVRPPTCQRPWVRCLRLVTTYVMMNLPVNLATEENQLPLVKWNLFWCRPSPKKPGLIDTGASSKRVASAAGVPAGSVPAPLACCSVRHRIQLLIVVFVGLLFLAVADFTSAFVFTVYLTSITGVTVITASLTGPFWIYMFVMPLVPIWAPFILFISIAYRNSRLARYAAASALFGCINIIVTIFFSNFTALLLTMQYNSERKETAGYADDLLAVDTFAFDKFLILPLCMVLLKCTIAYLLQIFIALIEMRCVTLVGMTHLFVIVVSFFFHCQVP